MSNFSQSVARSLKNQDGPPAVESATRPALINVVCIALLGLGGCRNSPDDAGSAEPGPARPSQSWAPMPTKPAVDLTKVKPDYVLTAEELHKEWQNDRNAAAAKFGGKLVELQGTVAAGMNWISWDGKPSVCLDGGSGGDVVVCYPSNEKEPCTKVGPLQKVTARGIAASEGPAMEIRLNECLFTEFGPNPTIVLSAEDLAREYKQDEWATQRKYDSRYLIVEGTVASTKDLGGIFGVVLLEGNGDTHVACNFSSDGGKLAQGIAVGQTVRLVGR